MRACSSSRRFLRWKDSSSSSTEVETFRGGRLPLPSGPCSDAAELRAPAAGALQDLHQVEIAGGLLLEARHHGFEHVERFALVLDQRIVLPVAAQPDALFQVVHVPQVVFPLRIEDAQHDHALVVAHGVGADQLFFRVVTFFQLGEDGVAEFLPAQRLGLDSFRQNVHAEAGEDRVFQSLDVPIVGMDFDARRTGPSHR